MLKEQLTPVCFPARAIRDFLNALDAHDYRLHGLMIVQHGKVRYASAAAPYTLQSCHRLFSSAKSILVLVMLHAIEHGKLRVTDKVVSFFPEYKVTDPGMLAMTVEDLLTMRTGQTGDPFGALFEDFDANLIDLFLHTPVDDVPGKQFRYNNTVPHLICAVTERAVGMPVERYFEEHFCHPMDAPVFAPTSRDGIYNPVVTTMSMESFLKYALVFLNNGRHEGMQLVDAALVQDAMGEHTQTGMDGNSAGYGYQIWRNRFGGARMDGGWGQFAFILPEDDACVVMLSDMTECSYAITAFEEHLLPAIRGEIPCEEPSSPIALRPLRPDGEADGSEACLHRWYRLEDGTRLMLERCPDALMLHLKGTHSADLRLGLNGCFLRNPRVIFSPSRTIDQMVYGQDETTICLCAAWSSPNVLEIIGKSDGEMGEYHHSISLSISRLTVRFQTLACHGIASKQAHQCMEGVAE